MRNFSIALFLLLTGLLIAPAPCLAGGAAGAAAPFYTRNLSPIVQVYGIPPVEGAPVPQGRVSARLVFNVSNNSAIDWSADDNVILDGETHRYDLALRYGLPGGVEVGVDLPYIRHGEGGLDGFIESFHETFGAGNGAAREAFDSGSLQYRYRRGGRNLLMLDEEATGIGDVRLSGALRLYGGGEGGRRDLTLRLGVELPTGDAGRLLGRGGTDISAYLSAADDATLSRWRISLRGSAGLLLTGEGEVLDGLRRDLVGFGSVGAGWSPFSWFAPKLQVDWHSPFYRDTELEPLSAWSAQAVMGAALGLPGGLSLDLGVAEDLLVKTAPDVTFHMALRGTF